MAMADSRTGSIRLKKKVFPHLFSKKNANLSAKALVVLEVLGHGAVVLVLVTLLEVLVVPVELVLLVALALVEVAVALVVLEK